MRQENLLKRQNTDQSFVIKAANLLIQVEIGKGRFGVVYKGKLDQTKEVAIKQFFQQNLSKEVQEEVGKEVRAMCRIRHLNVVTIYGYCPNPPIIAMEFMNCSLNQFLKSQAQIS